MRISDWSSDVCSSDLFNFYGLAGVGALAPAAFASAGCCPGLLSLLALPSLLAELYRNLLISSSSTTALCVYWISLFCLSILSSPPGVMPMYCSPSRPEVRMDADESLGNSYRSEEHTSELQSLMRISYAVFCLKK